MKKLLIITIFIFSFTTSQAQMSGIQAKLILDNIETTANNILNDAQFAGDELVNNATQNLLYGIKEFRQTFKEVLGETDSVLTKQQELLFNNLKATSDDLFHNIEYQQGLLNNNINAIGNILSNTIISNNRPIVTSFKVPVISEYQLTDGNDLEVTFYGIKLNKRKNYLQINNHRIDFENATTKTDSEITFRINDTLLPTNSDKVKISLHLHKWWKDYTQNFEIKILPLQIASVEINYISDFDCTTKHNRTVDLPTCRTSTPGLSYPRENNCSELISPTNNKRKIDINNVSIKKIYDRYGRGRCDLGRVTESGIQVAVHAKSERTSYGGSGKVICQVSFIEIDEKKCEKENRMNLDVRYNNPLVSRINDVKAIQSVKVKYYNGQVQLFNTLKDESSLIKYQFSPTTKTVSLSSNF